MSNNVIPFKVIEKEEVNEVAELIEHMEFDEVLVLGMKDDKFYMTATSFESKLRLLGAVEALKIWLYHNDPDGE